MQITKYEINIFKQFTELILRLQEYSPENEFPSWINFLQKIIFCSDINIQISLEAANFLIDLYSSSYSDSAIFKKIKENLDTKELQENEIDNDVLKNIIQKTGAKNIFYELLLGKFYLSLLEQNNQRNVIDLLVKIIKVNNKRFEEMVLFTLNNTKSVTSLIEGIKLFNEFWKLTNELYPEEIFFFFCFFIIKMLYFF